MRQISRKVFFGTLLVLLFFSTSHLEAQTITSGYIATTTVSTAICGNFVVDSSEDCDVPGETGSYSTTIAGRQCDVDCEFGPYCGDGILQTIYGEECDDGNNENGDFCSATCQIEPAGSGGGGSSGGGRGSSGGSNVDLGNTLVNIEGRSIPGSTVNILLDAESVGSVRANNSSGNFEFTTEADPGTVSMGFWTTDDSGIRSITFSTTFDVTQGAITDVNGIILPSTISVDDATVDPGDTVVFSGQTIPNATVELYRGSSVIASIEAGSDGVWTYNLDTSSLTPSDYSFRARTIVGSGSLTSQSGFSSSVQLFVGVDGQASTPSDLNRDGSVNLIDFSIMIFWWQTAGGDSDPPADINGNGNVGIEDFSILLFNWTG